MMQPQFANHQQAVQALQGAPSAPRPSLLGQGSPDRLAKGSEGKLFVAACPQLNEATLDYTKVQLPSVPEVERWVHALSAVPAEGSADVTLPVDYTLRFEMLSYLRNCGEEAQSLVLRSQTTNSDDVVELQFHGTKNHDAGAHAVAYLYRLSSGGVGAVLCFKGTTCNSSDWGKDLKIWKAIDGDITKGLTNGMHLFPDGAGLAGDAQVHPGYFDYYQTILARMKAFSVEHLQPLLQQWQFSDSGLPVAGTNSEVTNFLSWLQSGAWEWCVFVGHSMGGAMASYAATELAVHSKKTTMLSTSGTPGCGNADFLRLQNELLLPAGGLRIHNHGDVVTMTGYSGLALRSNRKCHAGRSVVLWPRLMHRLDPYHNHLRFNIPSDVFGQPLSVTYKFPGWTYDPAAEHSDAESFSTNFLGMQWTSSHDFPLRVQRSSPRRRGPVQTSLPPLWLQWFDAESGMWMPYCDEDQRLLRVAFAAEKPGVHLRSLDGEAYCDLKAMVQRSMTAENEFRETEMRVVFDKD